MPGGTERISLWIIVCNGFLKIDSVAKSYSLSISRLSPWDLSYTSEEAIGRLFIKLYFHKFVKQLPGAFYYICFWGADQFYLESSNGRRIGDGLIAGYDDDSGTYTIVARRAGVYDFMGILSASLLNNPQNGETA